MTKAKIYVMSGLSGAGKDTCASLLDATNIKFSSLGKRALEKIMDLPEGFLDDRFLRQQVAPDCQGRTYLQVLIDMSLHHQKFLGQDYFPRKIQSQILDCLGQGKDVVLTDVRHYSEMLMIADLNLMGYKVVPCWVLGGTAEPSDKYSLEIMQELCRRLNLTIPEYIDNRRRNMDFLEIRLAQIVAKYK